MTDWFEGAGSGGNVDVFALTDSEAMKRLMGLVQMGALVSFATTSDGGALGVTVTVDGRYRREYFRDAEAFDLWTEEAMAPVTAALDATSSSPYRGKRQRRARGA